MKTETVQETLLKLFKNAQTMIERIDVCDAIAADIINTDSVLISADKEWRSRGTWRVGLWMNEHHFGKELAEYLMRRAYILTHDEDIEWTLEDLREHIEDYVYEFASNYEEVEEE